MDKKKIGVVRIKSTKQCVYMFVYVCVCVNVVNQQKKKKNTNESRVFFVSFCLFDQLRDLERGKSIISRKKRKS